MHNNFNFEICLSELLTILNINGNKLAKALNVDPSLISKWKNGKRKISTDSNYIELISSYLADNIVNAHQEERIIHLFNNFNILLDDKSCSNMSDYIQKILMLSAQSSSALQNKNTTKENISNKYFKSMINPKIDNNQNSNSVLEKNEVNNFSLPSQQNIRSKYGYLSNFEVIIGNKNIIHAGIDLLKTLPKKPSHINEPILISFFTELDSFSNCKETYHEWNNTLLEIQKKGWNINKFACLSDNKMRNMYIIKELLLNLELERYNLNYINKHDALINFKEFIVIPTVGILICHCNENVNKIDIAFLLRDKHSLNSMKNVFNNYSNHSSPVINNKYNSNDLNLLSEITLSEESNGNRFAFNQFIVPLDNFSRYLYSHKEKISEKEISERICFHKRRIVAFNKQIKNYKFYDIWSKKSIEKLINNYDKSFNHIKPFNLLIHIENIINVLEKNDNYQIGLLNDTNTLDSYDVSYMIKDSHTVFVQKHHRNNNKSNDSTHNEICISITEPTIVNAFNNHFMELWDKISPINKDKKSVISWLKSQIKVLNNL